MAMSNVINFRRTQERLFSVVAKSSLFICVGILLFLLASIFVKGVGAMSLEFLFSPAKEFGRSGGVSYQLLGSLLLVLTATLFAVPLSLGTSLFLYSYSKNKEIQQLLQESLFALNAIPSITYGIFGLIFFVNFLNMGISWFVGSIILSIMMTPTATLATHQAMLAIPKNYHENAAALGLTKNQIVRRVTLPQSYHGVVTGTLIGLARAIGETAPIMFIATAFSGVTVPRSLAEPVSTLPTHILELAQQSTDPQALQNAWGASFLLMLLVCGFSLLALFARRYFGIHGRK